MIHHRYLQYQEIILDILQWLVCMIINKYNLIFITALALVIGNLYHISPPLVKEVLPSIREKLYPLGLYISIAYKFPLGLVKYGKGNSDTVAVSSLSALSVPNFPTLTKVDNG